MIHRPQNRFTSAKKVKKNISGKAGRRTRDKTTHARSPARSLDQTAPQKKKNGPNCRANKAAGFRVLCFQGHIDSLVVSTFLPDIWAPKKEKESVALTLKLWTRYRIARSKTFFLFLSFLGPQTEILWEIDVWKASALLPRYEALELISSHFSMLSVLEESWASNKWKEERTQPDEKW